MFSSNMDLFEVCFVHAQGKVEIVEALFGNLHAQGKLEIVEVLSGNLQSKSKYGLESSPKAYVFHNFIFKMHSGGRGPSEET